MICSYYGRPHRYTDNCSDTWNGHFNSTFNMLFFSLILFFASRCSYFNFKIVELIIRGLSVDFFFTNSFYCCVSYVIQPHTIIGSGKSILFHTGYGYCGIIPSFNVFFYFFDYPINNATIQYSFVLKICIFSNYLQFTTCPCHVLTAYPPHRGSWWSQWTKFVVD